MITDGDLRACSALCTCNNREFAREQVDRGLRVVAEARKNGLEIVVEDDHLVVVHPDGIRHAKEADCLGCVQLFKLVLQEINGLSN